MKRLIECIERSSWFLNRLLLIRYPHSRKLFTVRRACFGIGLSYAWAFFWAALPLFGWSDYDFEVKHWIKMF